MRDFDSERAGGQKDEAQAGAPLKVKARDEADAAHGHTPSHETEPHAAAHPEILRDERLAHPANAEPLADLLGQLQHSHGNTYVQRVVSEMGGAKSEAEPGTREAEARPRKAESRTSAGAHGLDAGVRSQMESAFGEDFGDVRLHTGGDAERLNEELGARAVTRGRDIYFGKGEYDSSAREGKELLAHELAHVVQQRESSSGAQSNSISQTGDAFEREADYAATAALTGQRAHVEGRSTAPALQRKEKGGGAPQLQDHGTFNVTSAPDHLTLQGDISLNFLFTKGGSTDTFHITMSAGVGVTAIDLSGTGIQVRDPGGTGTRAVIIVAPHSSKGPGLVQLTLTKGEFVHVLNFSFPPTAAAPAKEAPPPGPTNKNR